MRSSETDGFKQRRFLPEGEIGRQIEVGDETQDISQRVGHVDVDEALQDEVDAIVQGGGHYAHYDKLDKCRHLRKSFHLSFVI